MPAAPALAADERRIEYNIEAGDLGEALKTVSRLSGKEVIFNSEAVLGKTAPRLHGSFSADEAVRTLLQGTGLTARFRKDVILIRGRSEPSGDLADRSAGADEILVTGSRIRGARSTSPIIVATREEIVDAGQYNLGDYIRSIPQNFAGGQNPSVAGGGNQGAENQNANGSSNLNLRGLGADATLTLINGHRVAYDAVFGGVDISAIPLAAIERVEIVADGSSAIYGSDAVAGVANVILRRDLDGLITSARLGGSTPGGNFQQEYSVVGGQNWGSGGVMGAFDFNRSTAINGRDRNYTSEMDGSTTLFPRQRQYSGVLSAHQVLSSSIDFDIDAQYSNRTTEIAYPYTSTLDVTAEGLLSQPKAETYSVTPTLRINLSGRWRVSLTGTHGKSNTHLLSRAFSGGEEYAQVRIKYDGRVDSAEVNGEGPLATLAGGDVRLAIGAGFRSVGLDASSRTTFSGTTSTSYDISPIRENFFGYGELALPLIGSANARPLLHRLLLTGAVRYENYRGIGGLATPKLGLVYEPNSSVAIKASWGKSFKAPTLFEQYQTTKGTLISGEAYPDNPGGRPALLLYGGRRDLQPEKATTWTTSIAFRPIRALRVEFGYFDVRFNQRIVEAIGNTDRAYGDPIYDGMITYNPTEAQVLTALAQLQQPLANAAGRPLDVSQISAIFDDRLQNVSRQHVNGVDIFAEYEHQFGPNNRLSITGSASYLKGKQQISPGQPLTAIVGRIFYPAHWRARGGASWQRSDVTFSSFVNYTDGAKDTILSPSQDVSGFTTVDLSVRYSPTLWSGIGKGLEFSLSATNFLNQEPPRIRVSDPTQIPYDSTNASVTGRIISLTISKVW
ncbi:outer membrane receptor protein involved in Fe transport [Sphingomonas sp. BE270]|uniref:TonB-dependent receptor n=1 Tax=Sphingomonas sp. BE270 TaxID=2817726 RepID=UPI002861D1F2|nr:TonB-dependent receptor [Sphingomonas sp. BE270]MDR7256284.1 outer membrane receptor protein involved in Fe transport [Sphingomonas sp. BE270]